MHQVFLSTVRLQTLLLPVMDLLPRVVMKCVVTAILGSNSLLNNSQISISDDDYSGSGLPQLLLWLKFDEDSGTTALDSSGNSFHADLYEDGGQANSDPGWVEVNDAANNRSDKGLQFDGDN